MPRARAVRPRCPLFSSSTVLMYCSSSSARVRLDRKAALRDELARSMGRSSGSRMSLGGEHGGPPHDHLQLADVARPGVGLELLQRRRGSGVFFGPGSASEEVARRGGRCRPGRSRKGGKLQGDAVQPEVEVLAEAAVRGRLCSGSCWWRRRCARRAARRACPRRGRTRRSPRPAAASPGRRGRGRRSRRGTGRRGRRARTGRACGHGAPVKAPFS